MNKFINIDLAEYLDSVGNDSNNILYPDSVYYRKNKAKVSLKSKDRKYIPDSYDTINRTKEDF